MDILEAVEMVEMVAKHSAGHRAFTSNFAVVAQLSGVLVHQIQTSKADHDQNQQRAHRRQHDHHGLDVTGRDLRVAQQRRHSGSRLGQRRKRVVCFGDAGVVLDQDCDWKAVRR